MVSDISLKQRRDHLSPHQDVRIKGKSWIWLQAFLRDQIQQVVSAGGEGSGN